MYTGYGTLIFVVLVGAIACVLAYFARDLSFYEFDTTAAAYHVEVEQADLEFVVPVVFEYEGDTIHLIYDSSMTWEDISVYGNSRFGVARLTLETTIEQVGPLSLESKAPCDINSTCVVFAQSEIISLVARNVDRRKNQKKELWYGLSTLFMLCVFRESGNILLLPS